ncbi:MAG: hypothetical protein WHU95_07615 [candidate division WOR-3 bacterium]|nr:hypothetical protein [candidate division WOR-3 bacterium]MDH7519704.1 hypothetical protein [bacterium]
MRRSRKHRLPHQPIPYAFANILLVVREEPVRIELFDLSGRLVSTLVNSLLGSRGRRKRCHCAATGVAKAVYKQKLGSHVERKHRALLAQRPAHNNLDRKLYPGYLFVLTSA